MSNSVFQSVIVQLKEVSGRTFGVMDTEGSVISCTDMALIGERWQDAALKVGSAGDGVVTLTRSASRQLLVLPISLSMRCSAPVRTRLPAPAAPWPILP